MFETFQEFKETKNIDRTTLVSVLEESFRNVLAKLFGSDENFDVIVNPDKGDFEIHRHRIVVDDNEVQDENKEIALSEALKIEPDYEVGEEVSEAVDFTKFGRRAILNLRQTLASKILELDHDALYQKYKDKVGTVVSAEVYQMWKREVLLMDDEGNELHLMKGDQIPNDNYRKGETIRALVKEVTNENNNPRIMLSRTSPDFLKPSKASTTASTPWEPASASRAAAYTASSASWVTRTSTSSTSPPTHNCLFSAHSRPQRSAASHSTQRTTRPRSTCSLKR